MGIGRQGRGLLLPTQTDGVDEELWIIVGDLPPAYIVCDNAKHWREALDAYGVEMMKWVTAVRESRSIAETNPVNAKPTLENADLLERRIKTLWEIVDDPEHYFEK